MAEKACEDVMKVHESLKGGDFGTSIRTAHRLYEELRDGKYGWSERLRSEILGILDDGRIDRKARYYLLKKICCARGGWLDGCEEDAKYGGKCRKDWLLKGSNVMDRLELVSGVLGSPFIMALCKMEKARGDLMPSDKDIDRLRMAKFEAKENQLLVKEGSEIWLFPRPKNDESNVESAK